MKKILFCFCLFIFNILSVDSNSNKNTIYDYSDLQSKKYYKLYFVKPDKFLLSYLDSLNIEIYSYIKDDVKYYDVVDSFSGISCFCSVSDLIDIEREYSFY